jgi:ribosomal protein S18 acetylase RimI-like enzyme
VPSYRFCRPDDIPLLVHAVETCYRVHDPAEPAWSAEGFRVGMRAVDLWPSNSMVALDTDGEPVAVMIGTKRADEVAVHRLGVRPDRLRRGHGLHLLTSLSQKLAVLGPERLVAEVPDDRPAALGCFAAAGYRREATLVDWERPAGAGAGSGNVPEGLVSEVTVADLDGAGALIDGPETAWCRTRRTLVQSAERLRAAAVVSPDRVEGWVVYGSRLRSGELAEEPGATAPRGGTDSSKRGGEARPTASEGTIQPREDGGPSDDRARPLGSAIEVLAAGAGDAERLPLVVGVLLRWLAARYVSSPLSVPRLAPGELPADLLAIHGFVPGRTYSLLAATATPL